MFSVIKKVFSVLWKYKKYFVFVFFLVFLLWSARFPWNNFLSLMLKEQMASLKQQMDFESLKIKIFPPGVQFDKVAFIYQRKKIELDSMLVSLDLSQWLALKRAFNFELQKGKSDLLVNFYKKNLPAEEDRPAQELYFVRANSSRFELESLSSLLENNPLKGALSFQSSFNGSPQDVSQVQAYLKLGSGRLELSPYQWNSTLGPVNLPAMSWKKLLADVQIKEGELIFNKIELGEPGDPIRVQARGTGAFTWAYGRMRLNSYNIELQIDLKKDFNFSFLDLMFMAHKEENEGFYRYRLRLIGEGNQVPTMEKLESF